MRLHCEGSMIRVQCQLMICRGHIRASKGAFKIFLWLMVETMWKQHGDHGDVETTWGQHGDNMGTT